jgi:GNAT superfamily N-acetyltransferase
VNREYRVEPLGASHDRTTFNSGVLELDRYFQRQIGQDARRRAAAPFVMLDRQNAIVGYYTLASSVVRLPELPEEIVRKLPRYPALPVTLLGRLAVNRSHQGRNLGRILLLDALDRSWRNTSEVGSIGVVVDALDDRARAFCMHHEFIELRDRPNRLFRSMMEIDKAFKEA